MKASDLVFGILCTFSALANAQPNFISVHCPLGCPAIHPENTLVIKHIFTLSNNPNTKLADWVAYQVNPANYGSTPGRNYASDPLLPQDETLEKADYNGANSSLKSDKGHQAPLASFAGNQYWYETNYLSNITPQHKDLNQGVWKKLEVAVRDGSRYKAPLYVITGPLFAGSTQQLPNADEQHEVPSGYFKVVYDHQGNAAAFLMSQSLSKEVSYCDSIVQLPEVENLAGLEFSALRDSKKIYRQIGCT